MTVANTTVLAGPYVGNGVTTAFAFSFEAATAAEVGVALNGVVQVAGYTVTLNAGGNGGTVTFAVAPANGVEVIPFTNPLFTQDINFTNAGPFLPATHTEALDRAAIRAIYLKGLLARALLAPLGEGPSALPSAANRALKYLTFDAAGNPVATPTAAVTAASGSAVSTRTALGLIAAPVAGQLAFLTEAGREGLFVWDASNLQTRVAADTAQGLYVAPTATPNGSAGAWVRKFGNGPVLPEWFGMVANSAGAAAANVTAWNAMMAALRVMSYEPVANFTGLWPVRFGLGAYHFNAALDIDKGSLDIAGAGAGVGTRFVFPAGVSGLRVQYYETSGTSGGAGAAHEHSTGATIRDLAIFGPNPNAINVASEGEFHGVVLRAPAYLENVNVNGFPGDGFYINAGVASGTNRGNANLFRLVNCGAQYCRNGVYLGGTDANAYKIEGGNFINNRMWGIMEPDAASLGGVIEAAHFDSNGITTVAPFTVVSHGGNWYGVKHGQEAGASTNAPSGTTADNTWWYYIGAGGPTSDRPAWFNGINVRSGGPILAKSANAATMAIGCYSEPGYGLPQIDSPNWILGGGLAGYRIIGTGGKLRPESGFLTSSMSFKTLGNLVADGSTNRIGPPTGGIDAIAELRSSLDFYQVQFAKWTNNALAASWAEITGWSGGGGTIIHSAVDRHAFKTGAATYGASTTIVQIDTNGIDLSAGKVLKVGGTQVVSARGAAVADAAGGATVDAEARSAINALLARLRAHGLIAP